MSKLSITLFAFLLGALITTFLNKNPFQISIGQDISVEVSAIIQAIALSKNETNNIPQNKDELLKYVKDVVGSDDILNIVKDKYFLYNPMVYEIHNDQSIFFMSYKDDNYAYYGFSNGRVASYRLIK